MILARFVLTKGFPTLILFKAGGNESKAYNGPVESVDFVNLMQFVNQNTGRGPPDVKVHIILALDVENILNKLYIILFHLLIQSCLF